VLMMLKDQATSESGPPKDTHTAIPEADDGKATPSTGYPLYLPRRAEEDLQADTEAAFDGRQCVPRLVLQEAQSIMGAAVCDGRPLHARPGEGFEAAMVDACLRLARLMHPVPRAMLRSKVPDPRVEPGDPLPFVSFDRFVRILASKIRDVGTRRPVRVVQLPHQFTKQTPCGLPESAKLPHTGFTTRSFKALMHVACGNLTEDNASTDFERVLRDDAVFESHYVLKNAPRATGPDIVVIMQGATPGVFTVIFLQCKFCSSDTALNTNTSKAAIEAELVKALERRAELKAPVGGDAPVEPYFAIVQQCLPPSGSGATARSRDAAVRKRLHRVAYTKVSESTGKTIHVPSNVVRSDEVHAELATSGVWFVSASEPSPLLPGLCTATDITPGAEYTAFELP
jgi:hypothetical protein